MRGAAQSAWVRKGQDGRIPLGARGGAVRDRIDGGELHSGRHGCQARVEWLRDALHDAQADAGCASSGSRDAEDRNRENTHYSDGWWSKECNGILHGCHDCYENNDALDHRSCEHHEIAHDCYDDHYYGRNDDILE